ncbi:two-component system response regulator ResD [Halanaerobium saccharolyticum]|uniref:Stage 0 sporulation protein A homolog n=1 Tax=Halanaerobium saccharolyticum TaxID=43595 RepID=A0A2T5RFT9_9FIRM|nr:response regulator transcription factor [Halanaerobium saccharolyticum]PTV93241.1 two-component system response regulator ResD [Halanaerobium saccharolyticum]
MNLNNKKILLIEDDKNIFELVKAMFNSYNTEVVFKKDGKSGYKEAIENDYDLILLDIMLPEMDGWEICKKLKEKKVYTPIIMLTAKAEEADKVLGLEIGADDYVTKPFSPRELRARIKAVLRRTENQKRENNSNSEVYDFSNFKFKLDNDDKSVSINNQIISFAPREFELFEFMIKNYNKVFSRKNLLKNIWGAENNQEIRTIDEHIKRIRRKLKEKNINNKFIKTIWGTGYKFKFEEDNDED